MINPLNNMYSGLKSEIKNLSKNPASADYRRIKEMAGEVKNLALIEIENKNNKSTLSARVNKFFEKMFEKCVKLFHNKTISKNKDLGKVIIHSVLIGNILKDLVTGIVSSSQSFTNPDYNKEKRLLMGSYDVMACLTTISLSVLMGPMLVNKINNSIKKMLKPIEKSPKFTMIATGLTAFTTIVLQSIVAKRMIAPALSTPLAGIMKDKLSKKQVNS